jgi:putative ABC transport system permease protein
MSARDTGEPPRFAELALRRMLPPGAVGESITGDLREEYATLVQCAGSLHAAQWYVRQAWGIGWRGVHDRMRGSGPFTTHARKSARSGGRNEGMQTILRAMRHAGRGLIRTPQFTIAAVITLALAIGTNASIFSIVQGVLLKPLPFQDAEQLYMLRHSAPALGYDDFGMSPGLYLLYRGEDELFASSGIYSEVSSNITGGDAAPERVVSARAARDVFTTLGATPAAGRIFDSAEEQPGAESVVVLSHALWQERFGGTDVIGRSIDIDGEPRTIVGIMPASFEFPNRETRLWLPLPLDSVATTAYGNFSFQAVARLREGVDPVNAAARLQPHLRRVGEGAGAGDFGAFMEAGKLAATVIPLKRLVVGDITRPLLILLGTVAFVFLIACANVSNLVLARAEARQKEMSVRAAMGAGRPGLIGHYATESLLIAVASGVLGLLLTFAVLRVLLRIAPPNIPRLHEVSIDPVVVAFTLLTTLLAAVLLGILPALRLTSPDMLAMLSRYGRGTSAGRERNRTRQLLVVAQTALALVLLVGSGLMVRSFQNMRALDPGFSPDDALTFRISLPVSTYRETEQVTQFNNALLERLRTLPGVRHVGATSHAPLAGCCSGTAHVIEDHPVAPGQLPPMFWYASVSDGYFEAMRIPLRAGRTFDTSDRNPQQRSVIVSDALAQKFWPNSDAVGKRLRLSSDSTKWYTVIGVVGNVRDQALDNDDVSQTVYYPVAAGIAGHARNMTYVVHAAQPDAIAQATREQVWALDSNLPIASTQTYEKIVADSMIRLSFTMLALVAAAAIALILGAIGLYSVISYLVTQRTNEIGIRLALGARPAQVRSMVVIQGALLTVIGLLIGLAGALALTRLMQGILFGTAPTDPATFAVVSAVLAGIALVATYVPAYRASRIDPATSLKAE